MNKTILIILIIIFVYIAISYFMVNCLFEKYFTRNKDGGDDEATFYKVLEWESYVNMVGKMK